MAFQPSLADIQEADKNLASSEPTQSFQPTAADIQALGAVPESMVPRAQVPEGSEQSFVQKLGQAGEDILSIPGALYRLGKGTYEDFAESPYDVTKEFVEGFPKPIFEALQLAAKGMEVSPQLGGFPSLQQLTPGGLKEELAAEERYQPEQPEAPATRLGELAGSLLPIMKVGNLTEGLVRMAMEELPEFFGKSVVTGVGAGAAMGATIAPLVGMDPEESAMIGGLLPAGIQPLSKLLRGAVRGKSTAEEFAEARAQVPEGIKAPIGELADSPAMMKAYQQASGLWGSGAAKPYEQLNAYLDSGLKKVRDDVPQNVTDPNQFVYDDMLGNYQAAKAATSDAYSALADRADAQAYQFDSRKFTQAANTQLAEIEELLVNPTIAKEMAPIVDKIKGHAASEIPTFKKAMALDRGLTKSITKARGSEDFELARHLQILKSSLRDSMDDSAEQFPELYDDYIAAKQARVDQGKFEKLDEKTKSPFYKTYLKGKEADTGNFISEYLKKSTNLKDKSGLLEQLTNKISPESIDVMKEQYLTDVVGEEKSVAKTLSLAEALSDKQIGLLFDEDAQEMTELVNLGKLFPEAKSAAFEPKTGFAGSKGQQKAGGIGMGAYFLGTGRPELAAMAFLGIPALGQTMQRVLRSKGLKTAYEKALDRKSVV